MAQLKVQLRLMLGAEIALGPGKADLLAAIAEYGSISAAGAQLGMSYLRTWKLVDTMNRCFRQPLVETATGGARGGGARLTPSGIEVLDQYRRMEAAATAAAKAHFATIDRQLAKSARVGASAATPKRKKPAAKTARALSGK